MNCDVQAYTDCKMTMEEVPFKSYDMVKGTYITKKCTESSEVIQHTKSAPECKYVKYLLFICKPLILNVGKKNNVSIIFVGMSRGRTVLQSGKLMQRETR